MRAVALDFYGTLAEDEPWDVPPPDLFARRGHEPPPEEWWASWYTNAIDGTEHVEHSQSRSHYVDWERRHRVELLRGHGLDDDDIELFMADFDDLRTRFVMRAYPEVPDVLRELRGAGLRLAICSNWDWDLDIAVEQAGLAGLIDVQITSAQVGCRKPHPRIFEETLAALDVNAGQVVFVGDSWHADVEGPLDAGIAAVHVWRDGPRWAKRPVPPPAGEVPRIPDLSTLPSVVRGFDGGRVAR